MKIWIWAVAMCALCATVRADWQVVAEVAAGGEPKELSLEREVRVIQIEGTAGSVRVETLWVLEGVGENLVSLARDFLPGETQDIDLGGDRQVTGLRIRDGGQGKYKVSVK